MLLFVIDDDGQPILISVCEKDYDLFYGAALKRLGNREEAQDAVQEALLSFIKTSRKEENRKRFEKMDAEATSRYIMRCVVNCCIKTKSKSWRTVSLDDIQEPADRMDVATMTGSRAGA